MKLFKNSSSSSARSSWSNIQYRTPQCKQFITIFLRLWTVTHRPDWDVKIVLTTQDIPLLYPISFQGCKPRNQSICLNPIIFFYFIDKICTKVRVEYSITAKSYLEIVFKILMNVFFTAPANKSIVHGAIENPDDHPKWRITSPNPELQNNKSAIYKEIESDNSSDFASCNPSAQFLSTPEHSSWQRTRA